MTDIDWLVAVPEPVRVTGRGVESRLSVARVVNRKLLAVGDFDTVHPPCLQWWCVLWNSLVR